MKQYEYKIRNGLLTFEDGTTLRVIDGPLSRVFPKDDDLDTPPFESCAKRYHRKRKGTSGSRNAWLFAAGV